MEGRWQVILVDDKIPVLQGRPMFSRCLHKHLWVSLLEKAFAKAYGCYEALEGGLSREGLSALTGEPVYSIWLPKSEDEEGVTSDGKKLWQNLAKFIQAGYLMGASCGRMEDDQQKYKDVGLITQHVYSLMDIEPKAGGNSTRLVCLRNPHGSSKWSGKWCDDSALWSSSRVPPALRNKRPNKQGNGIFWMSFEDFLQYFETTDVCKLRPDWHETRFTAPFYRTPEKSFLVVMLTVVEETSVDFMIHQLKLRSAEV